MSKPALCNTSISYEKLVELFSKLNVPWPSIFLGKIFSTAIDYIMSGVSLSM